MKKLFFKAVFFSLLLFSSCNDNIKTLEPIKLQGFIFGTSFTIIYYDVYENYNKEVNKLSNIKPVTISTSEFKCWDNRFLIKSNIKMANDLSNFGYINTFGFEEGTSNIINPDSFKIFTS